MRATILFCMALLGVASARTVEACGTVKARHDGCMLKDDLCFQYGDDCCSGLVCGPQFGDFGYCVEVCLIHESWSWGNIHEIWCP